jgi:DNA polymerase eta
LVTLLLSIVFFAVFWQNGRVARQLTVGVRQLGDKKPSSFSRCCPLVRYDVAKISGDSFAIIKSLNAAGHHQAAW